MDPHYQGICQIIWPEEQGNLHCSLDLTVESSSLKSDKPSKFQNKWFGAVYTVSKIQMDPSSKLVL